MMALLLASSKVADASPWPSETTRLLSQVRSGKEKAKVEALQSLVSLGAERARPGVVVGLGDPSVKVRNAAGRVAAALRLRGLESQVRPWLKAREPELRALAVELSVADADREQARRILALLSDPSSVVRAALARSVVHFPKDLHSSLSPVVAGGLNDAEPEIRAQIAEALGRMGTSREALSLAARLQDSDPSVRIQVALALGVTGGEAVVAPLLVALGDDDDEVVAAVARALGGIGADAAVPGLLSTAMTGRQSTVVRASIEALARVGTSSAIEALFRLLRTAKHRVLAEKALATVVGRSELESCFSEAAGEELISCARLAVARGLDAGALLQLVEAGRLRARDVVSAYRERSHDRITILALEMLGENDRASREEAISYFSRWERLPSTTAAPLEKALSQGTWTLHETATLLLLLARCEGGVSEERLRPYLKSTHRKLRGVAAFAMARSGVSGDSLVELLSSPHDDIREGVLQSLRGRTSMNQAETVIELLVEGKSGLRSELLQSVWTFPKGLSDARVKDLLELLREARGGERDQLLSALAENGSEGTLLRLAEQGDRDDRIKLAQLAMFHPSGAAVARALLGSGARETALALATLAKRGAKKDISIVAEVLQGSEAVLVQAAALDALRLLSAGKAEPELQTSVKRYCGSAHARVRFNAALLASTWGNPCNGLSLEEILSDEHDSRIRKAAAHALRDQDPESAALSICTQYEKRVEVQAVCAGTTDDSVKKRRQDSALGRRQKKVGAPGVRGLARGMPYVVRTNQGIRTYVSDRNGFVLLEDNETEQADPWWAY